MTTSLLKPSLKTSLLEALYNEILTNSNHYYYFIGKPSKWNIDDSVVGLVEQSAAYEQLTREEMVFLKKITSADVSFVIPRHDWESGIVYDMYDDQLGHFTTVNATAPNNVTVLTGTFDVETMSVGSLVTGTNIAAATYVTQLSPTQVTISNPTTGVVNGPVTFTIVSASGASSLANALFYTMTSELNVYKCLNNGGGAPSVIKPYGTSHELLKMSDGYVWKYMYTIPKSLAQRFMTPTDIPVSTSVKNQFYSRGSITSATILNYGQGYTESDSLVVTGDGALEGNTYRIINTIIRDPGTGYVSAPTVTVQDPYPVEPQFVLNPKTFNAATAVNTTAETITITAHGFTTGDAVFYSNGGGTSIGGLTTGTTYYAIVVDTNTVKLAATKSDALAETPVVNLSAVGSGTNQSLFKSNISLIAGQYIKSGSNTYEAVGAGVTGTSPPTHTSIEPQFNGTVPLKFVGQTPTATATITTGSVTAVTLSNIIGYINIINPGYGYTTLNPPAVTITGAGNGATATVDIISKVPTAVELAFEASSLWTSTSSVALDAFVRYDNRVYKVVAAGVTGSTAPTHTVGSVANGTATLQYIGDTTPIGRVARINLTNRGSGYVSGSTSVLIDPPFTGTTAWLASASVTTNTIVSYSNKFYKVLNNGALGSSPPTHTGGSQPNGAVSLLFVGQTAEAEADLFNGFGYTTIPLITASAPPTGTQASLSLFTQKTAALLVPVVENGQIVNVIAQEPGIGYTTASIFAQKQTGTAAVVAELIPNISFGDLTSRQSNVELLAIPGTIDSIVITNPGANVSSATVTIVGDGTGAVVRPEDVVILNGRIQRINLFNHGSGYTYANVVIVTNEGAVLPYARAVISPNAGHGNNAIREFQAQTLILYTSVSAEKNQGVVVDNDYHQIGIIRNPLRYQSSQRYSLSTGSTCFSIAGLPVVSADIQPDDILWDAAVGGNQFQVVSVPESPTNTSSIIVQSLSNAGIKEGTILYFIDPTNPSQRKSGTITSVLAPNVNKYSGDLLFIDNRVPFLPSDEQTVSIKTAIRL